MSDVGSSQAIIDQVVSLILGGDKAGDDTNGGKINEVVACESVVSLRENKTLNRLPVIGVKMVKQFPDPSSRRGQGQQWYPAIAQLAIFLVYPNQRTDLGQSVWKKIEMIRDRVQWQNAVEPPGSGRYLEDEATVEDIDNTDNLLGTVQIHIKIILGKPSPLIE